MNTQCNFEGFDSSEVIPFQVSSVQADSFTKKKEKKSDLLKDKKKNKNKTKKKQKKKKKKI